MKEISPCIKDTLYPRQINNPPTRLTARGIIFNKEGKVCLLHMVGDDLFGHLDHYEFPGGGVDGGETPHQALKREIAEEIGYSIREIIEVGTLAIEYHLLKRIDLGHFFIAQCDKAVGMKREAYENNLINEVCWIPWNEVESLLMNPATKNIGQAIHHRERLAFQAAKSIWMERSSYAVFTHQSR